MDVTHLRKLTRKSSLKFGKYGDLTIQTLLDLQKHNYLRWIYFNSSMVTFFDDILDEIIPEKYRIEKPGKNPELHDKLYAENVDNFPIISRIKFDSHQRKIKKSKLSHLEQFEFKPSKSKLQSKNHGH